MKKLTIITGLVTLGFSSISVAENTYMPSYVEQGLIQICKSAANDKMLKMNKSIKDLKLKHKTVALKVVCNGRDIISFAEHYGAQKTASRLSNSIGSVEVTDIASTDTMKYDVKFDF